MFVKCMPIATPTPETNIPTSPLEITPTSTIMTLPLFLSNTIDGTPHPSISVYTAKNINIITKTISS
jgi:hypothetical protein